MTDYRAAAERYLETAARHLTELPGDMRIAEMAARIGQGYATLALLDGQQPAGEEDGLASKSRRRRLTTKHLEAVAAIYREARESGLGPTRAVANHFDVPHSTAAKWVGHARSNGLIPATVKGHTS
jgi:transposase